MLGVLPAPAPRPLWIGEIAGTPTVRPEASVAVAPSETPGWTHILVSIRNAQPGARYDWTVRSSACGDASGSMLGTADRYQPLIARADGSAAAEATVPVPTSRATSARYSVSLSGGASGDAGTCADLAYTTF